MPGAPKKALSHRDSAFFLFLSVLSVFLFECNHVCFLVGMAFGFRLGDEGDHFFIGFGDDFGQVSDGVVPVF